MSHLSYHSHNKKEDKVMATQGQLAGAKSGPNNSRAELHITESGETNEVRRNDRQGRHATMPD